MAFKQSIINMFREAHANAPWGHKGVIIGKYAKLLGCSEKQLRRLLETGRKRKKEPEKTQALQELTRLVYSLKHKVTDNAPPLSTDQAYAAARKNNLIKEGTPDYSLSSINRMARQLGFHKKQRRIQRYQAEYPNQLHHVDASTSSVFYVEKILPNGEYILKLNEPTKNYKNKPNPVKLRVWLYAVTDDYSGYNFAHYTVGTGECAEDFYLFLERAWTQNSAKPFCGLPDKIKADLGPLMRGNSTAEYFERLRIEIDPSTPKNKDAHGKVERPWRTHWQRFERQFFLRDNWKEWEISLTELNKQFSTYLNTEYNQRSHRYEKHVSREQMWRRISRNGGIRPLPENAFKEVHKRIPRTVQKDGTFTLDHTVYEVKGLHDAKVEVLLGVLSDEIKVRDIESGKIYEVELHRPLPVGTFKAHTETPLQKLKKESDNISITKSLFEENEQKTRVINMPVRIKEEQAFERIFNTENYRDIKVAMTEFSTLTGIIPEAGSEKRAELEQLFIDNKLSRAFVKEVASRVNRANEDVNRRAIHG